ncbi:hypothetical protein D5b_00083 [Faustovirus]|nr:hypothetical protein D5b_00083 [Faustovirus]AMN84827.1 hypothetical protein D6_00427 [Faustovirus]AMP44041.1 hypothetical protein PRJ_Dakar_00082 [Faustovirus]
MLGGGLFDLDAADNDFHDIIASNHHTDRNHDLTQKSHSARYDLTQKSHSARYDYSMDSMDESSDYFVESNEEPTATLSSNEVETPDIIYIESTKPLTVFDLVKSRRRGVKSEPVKPAGKPNKIIVAPKRGVKAQRSAPIDAELTCLARDVAVLRKHCEYLYNYFTNKHITENLPIAFYIRAVFDKLITFTNFKILIRLLTGELMVDFMCNAPYIEVKCKCGTFRTYISDLCTTNVAKKRKYCATYY